VLAAANAAFLSANLSEDDVVSTWAGLRPLLRPRRATSPSAISRDYALFREPSGLISVGGGKLTAFRAMAEHIVDQILPGSGNRRHRHASRSALPGSDAPLPTDDEWQRCAHQTGTTQAQLREWCSLYGSHLADVAARLPAERSDDPALDWHRAMTRYAVDCEMAQRLEDVFVRRTGLMLFSPDNGRSWLEPLSVEMASLLGWSAERRRKEVSSTAAAIDRMFAFREGARKPTLQPEFVGRN
jgi:glycerol-3-phosphate dehydrogenase